MLTPPRTVLHRGAGLYAMERALHRRGFTRVAGVDEAGRGACAGPLVVAAVILPPGRRGEVTDLADSKMLTPQVRERVFAAVVAQAAAYAVVIIPPDEIDGRGLHVCNVAGMRRALAQLPVRSDYVLSDGFRVDGLGVPGLAVWKGDQVAACVAAASVVAKVTRDRIMVELDQSWPAYKFAEHKGYVTPEHSSALRDHGPCTIHRFSYANVAAVTGLVCGPGTVGSTSDDEFPDDGFPAEELRGDERLGEESGEELRAEASAGFGSGPAAGHAGGVGHVGGLGHAGGTGRAAPALVGENIGMEGGQG